MSYPRIIAHRCGGRLAAENSLAGLAAAARAGCRGVEFDVMLSADGVPVLMHDDRVDRTTNCKGLVAELSLEQLRQATVGSEPVPTLEEALGHCRRLGLWANIEIKPNQLGAEATARAVARILARCWDGHGIVSSFAEPALAEMQCRAPQISRALLVESPPADWLERLRALGGVALHCAARCLEPKLLEAATAAGVALAAYTINDRAAADRWLAAGMAAAFTDRPDLWRRDEM